MPITIIESKNESMVKRFFSLNINSSFELIDDQISFLKIINHQESLFSKIDKKDVFCFINVLQTKFKNELDGLRNHTKQKLFFLEFGKKTGRKYLPNFLKNKAKIIDLNKISKSFSFWQKIAAKLGVEIEFGEWQAAINLIGSQTSLLFSVLEQKQIAPKYQLNSLLDSWPEGNIFKLLDALDKKNTKETLELLYNFFQGDSDFNFMWNQIVRHFINLGQLANGFAPKIHPYALAQLKKSLVNYSNDELKNILTKILDLDVKLKTGFFESKLKEVEAIYFLIFSLLFSSWERSQPELLGFVI